MSWVDLIMSILEILTWPSVFVIIAFILRRNLHKLLEKLLENIFEGIIRRIENLEIDSRYHGKLTIVLAKHTQRQLNRRRRGRQRKDDKKICP